jgi:hypothetical protein
MALLLHLTPSMKTERLLVLMAVIGLSTSLAAAHVGSTPVTSETRVEKPYLNNVVQISAGGVGTGYHLGNGEIITAAHNFTTDPYFPGSIIPPVIYFADGTEVRLETTDYDVLIDPNSELEIKWNPNNRSSVAVPSNDVAILKITNPKILRKLSQDKNVELGGVNLKPGMQLESIGLLDNDRFSTMTNLTGQPVHQSGERFGSAAYTMAEMRASSFQKFVATPNGEYRSLPGDSGGPMFFHDPQTGKSHLVSVHHASLMNPQGTTFLPFSVDQMISIESLKSFESVRSPRWAQVVKPPTEKALREMPNEFWNEIRKKYFASQLRGYPRLAAEQDAAANLNRRFLWALSEVESQEFAKAVLRGARNGDVPIETTHSNVLNEIRRIASARIAMRSQQCRIIFSTAK